jgi:hydrogenase maturation protein HypF
VQGVGFRPYVYKLALEFQLHGWVNNTMDGVHIEFNASAEKAETFFNFLIENVPKLCVITEHNFFEVERKLFNDFEILQSKNIGPADLLLTSDFAMCPQCKNELNQSRNRRYAYAFTTCTHCGPRYSISRQLPYDRETTTMAEFPMCNACKKEFLDPEDRRYYSQTNSCPDCRIDLQLFDNHQRLLSLPQDKILDEVVALWKQGKIVAIKGIGGYLLTCDATNNEAIMTLRNRKQRPNKPFALMFPNLEELRTMVVVGAEELKELGSPASPIVLFKCKQTEKSAVIQNAVAPGLDQIGVLLPYTPLYVLLLQKFEKAIVATSGNVTNAPIVYQDEIALEKLSGIADYILVNNREIVIPQDDSVVKYSPLSKQRIVFRRSRGIAPSYINGVLNFPKETLLATGADLKSTLTLMHEGNCFISQFIGDLESFDTQVSYKKMLDHFGQLFNAQPEVMLSDFHPNYYSTRLAESLASHLCIPIEKCQHHIAHFGAVLGENNLIATSEMILGVVWDGTGFGDDGHIWGGEFFIYHNFEFERFTHFEYFPFILGNKMPKEPRISALALCHQIPTAQRLLKGKFSTEEWNVYKVLLKKERILKSSSLGRIFDAVASLLGLIDHSSYEGEAAMLLENLAWKYIDAHGMNFKNSYVLFNKNVPIIPTQNIMEGVLSDLKNEVDKSQIAAKFHYTLIQIIPKIAEHLNINQIAFSGGVFQNSLLVDMIHHFFHKDLKLYFHKQLSPNDENISFGQLICYQILDKKRKTKNNKLLENSLPIDNY